ncbi:uncharacterized protein A4U43_C09F5780 [Asparagus officinalis]|uniref:Uncharacterized protein n=1 Tax=Asparagus officinalis TaxID=4686 RepID=A0A5P1E5K9_ASPOF|nr:uncharacterized protein A4U43_C09F5780 [Asparagus officinalis]
MVRVAASPRISARHRQLRCALRVRVVRAHAFCASDRGSVVCRPGRLRPRACVVGTVGIVNEFGSFPFRTGTRAVETLPRPPLLGLRHEMCRKAMGRGDVGRVGGAGQHEFGVPMLLVHLCSVELFHGVASPRCSWVPMRWFLLSRWFPHACSFPVASPASDRRVATLAAELSLDVGVRHLDTTSCRPKEFTSPQCPAWPAVARRRQRPSDGGRGPCHRDRYTPILPVTQVVSDLDERRLAECLARCSISSKLSASLPVNDAGHTSEGAGGSFTWRLFFLVFATPFIQASCRVSPLRGFGQAMKEVLGTAGCKTASPPKTSSAALAFSTQSHPGAIGEPPD